MEVFHCIREANALARPQYFDVTPGAIVTIENRDLPFFFLYQV
jgi:hypothetical protein